MVTTPPFVKKKSKERKKSGPAQLPRNCELGNSGLIFSFGLFSVLKPKDQSKVAW